MLKGKTILLGVTGSIAAYKIAALASMLIKLDADVHVIMTANAVNFINPITFETLTNNKCLIETFDRNFEYQVEHVSLAKKVDLVVIAPATANVISKLAHGLADDMLTTTILACQSKKIVAPAMNTRMFTNAIVQDNIETLKHYGFEIVAPIDGRLACGDTGDGKMVEPEVLLEYILKELAFVQDMRNKKVLITAGPTQEAIDPVRYITNHSSGKMGYALARVSMQRGAMVTLISGSTNIAPPPFIETVMIRSAKEMYTEVIARAQDADIIIKAAAVADYRPQYISNKKVKKSDSKIVLELEQTADILKTLGENKKPNQFLCGFAMETEDVVENSRKKLISKDLDMIVANNLKDKGAGFKGDTNIVTLITANEEIELPLMDKVEVASHIIDKILTGTR
jgi:phosphopantothenoylcysteine decarboxylase/phosphopantothenate--cysteine ligase, prokaryotic